MTERYFAVPVDRKTLLDAYPEAMTRSLSATFASSSTALAKQLQTPDFDEIRLFLVKVGDDAWYVATAAPGDQNAADYPPQYIKLKIVAWGDERDASEAQRLLDTTGDTADGVLLNEDAQRLSLADR